MKRKHAIARSVAGTAALAIAAVVIGMKRTAPVEIHSLHGVAASPDDGQRTTEWSEAQKPPAAELFLKSRAEEEYMIEIDGNKEFHFTRGHDGEYVLQGVTVMEDSPRRVLPQTPGRGEPTSPKYNDETAPMPFGDHPFGPWRTGGSYAP